MADLKWKPYMCGFAALMPGGEGSLKVTPVAMADGGNWWDVWHNDSKVDRRKELMDAMDFCEQLADRLMR